MLVENQSELLNAGIQDNESELLNAGWLLTEEDVKDFDKDAFPTLRIRTFTQTLNAGLSIEITFCYSINEQGKIVKLVSREVYLIHNQTTLPFPLPTMDKVYQLIELIGKPEVQHG